jgi:hypothetical protein
MRVAAKSCVRCSRSLALRTGCAGRIDCVDGIGSRADCSGQRVRGDRELDPGGVGIERGRRQVGPRAVDQVGEDLLNDGVATVVGLGAEEWERPVGEQRVIPVGGEQLALALRGGLAVECSPAARARRIVGFEDVLTVDIWANQLLREHQFV